MPDAGELFQRSFPPFPKDYADDYLRNEKYQNEFSEFRSKELGNDEAEPERGWNHNCREEP